MDIFRSLLPGRHVTDPPDHLAESQHRLDAAERRDHEAFSTMQMARLKVDPRPPGERLSVTALDALEVRLDEDDRMVEKLLGG